jgi:hypothetical protein
MVPGHKINHIKYIITLFKPGNQDIGARVVLLGDLVLLYHIKSKCSSNITSSILAKTEEELNSGRQHQSIHPVFDTRAALLQLPITP